MVEPALLESPALISSNPANMHLVDSHCHINFEPLNQDIPELLREAASNHIKHMLCVSVTVEELPDILAMAESYPNIFASAGVHPNVTDGKDPSTEELIQLASHPQVVAIGETGLDYFRSEGDLEWQHQRFHRHISAAKTVSRPLIIHTREAANDTMETLKNQNAEECGGVIHCFTEDWDTAVKALDLGFYISFSGIVTFKSAKSVQDVAKRMPLERMLVETDSPYLAPVPYRGKTNQPAYTRHVAEHIAQLRGIPVEQVAEQTTENFFSLFSSAQAS